ncbi:DUF1724 domain-containing protein [Methanolobus mangrovi]|uniref:DUF1724 domain-containing protein n=1 Tax=Methanolobus mangrovi TaxID=3072977 RepID=A0AA51YIX8_9EURY|nr:transcriptional regulator FilR1 domain-containing protein [Methanolobus mangrovi]WMW22008.1 DUF1724 domain-containing protein [Methanolobus mangrovi]
MAKALLNVLFTSEKRKKVLLLLKDGPMEMDTLLKSLETTRQALLPQVKILKDNHLICDHEDTYGLTIIGKLIIDEMTSLLDIIELLDGSIDYWGSHYLDFIPPHLLERIDELRKCKLIKPKITELYEINTEFFEASKKAKSHYIVTTFLHPNFIQLANDLITNNINIYFISSQDLLDKMIKEYHDDFEKIIQNHLVHAFVYSKKMDFQFVAFNECYAMLSLLRTNGEFDSKYLLCKGKTVNEWGIDFYNCYLKDSKPVTDI